MSSCGTIGISFPGFTFCAVKENLSDLFIVRTSEKNCSLSVGKLQNILLLCFPFYEIGIASQDNDIDFGEEID